MRKKLKKEDIGDINASQVGGNDGRTMFNFYLTSLIVFKFKSRKGVEWGFYSLSVQIVQRLNFF